MVSRVTGRNVRDEARSSTTSFDLLAPTHQENAVEMDRRHPAESLGIKQPPHARGVHATPHEDGGEYPNGCTETRNYGPINDNGERQSVLARTLETYMRKSNLVRI